MTDASKCTAFKGNGLRCQGGRMGDTSWCSSHQTKEARAKGVAVAKKREEEALAAEEAELLGTPMELERAELRNHSKAIRLSGVSSLDALTACERMFRKWMGEFYDLGALHVSLAACAVEWMDGDPLWVLIVSGPGNAKTETVNSASGAGAVVMSDISGPAALLSGTPEKERSSQATGGLLVRMGNRGTLVIKDFTTILSMSRDKRAEVMGALREIYDGRWSRFLGTDGGVELVWEGRVVIIGAVTTAWDAAYAAIATMGDRFVLMRTDSNDHATRKANGRQAMRNTGLESEMRTELAAAFGAVIAAADTANPAELTDAECDKLLDVANLVTRARTGVEREFNSDPSFAHALEAPTRFVKQLQQVVRGGVAIGMPREAAMALAVRCGRDSMPPLSLKIVDCLLGVPDGAFMETSSIRRLVNNPRRTVDRELQSMWLLGVLERNDVGIAPLAESDEVEAAVVSARWAYRLAPEMNPMVLRSTGPGM